MTNDIALQELKDFGAYENTLVDNATTQKDPVPELQPEITQEYFDKRADVVSALGALSSESTPAQD